MLQGMSDQRTGRTRIFRRTHRIGALAVMLLLSVPSVALASGNAAHSEYTRQSVDPSSTLPFTGYAVIGVLLIAMILLSAGALLRRVRAED
jgi:hypothetical protein